MPHLHVIGPATYADAPRVTDSELLEVADVIAGAIVLTPHDSAPSEPASPSHPTAPVIPMTERTATSARTTRRRVLPAPRPSGDDAA